jgi:hypothetical protein
MNLRRMRIAAVALYCIEEFRVTRPVCMNKVEVGHHKSIINQCIIPGHDDKQILSLFVFEHLMRCRPMR